MHLIRYLNTLIGNVSLTGTVFTTLHFLRNLQAKVLHYTRLERFITDKHWLFRPICKLRGKWRVLNMSPVFYKLFISSTAEWKWVFTQNYSMGALVEKVNMKHDDLCYNKAPLILKWYLKVWKITTQPLRPILYISIISSVTEWLSANRYFQVRNQYYKTFFFVTETY